MGATRGAIRRIVGEQAAPGSLPLREGPRCAPLREGEVRALLKHGSAIFIRHSRRKGGPKAAPSPASLERDTRRDDLRRAFVAAVRR
jgi:hypothetical protein